jgi:hypothetical protein
MTVLFTLSINAAVSAQQGPTRAAEQSYFGYLTGRALQLAGTGQGQALSGNLIDENGVVCGTYAYTPIASQ